MVGPLEVVQGDALDPDHLAVGTPPRLVLDMHAPETECEHCTLSEILQVILARYPLPAHIRITSERMSDL